MSEAKKDGPLRTVFVATVLCICCSVLVSATAVALKERQRAEVEFDQQRNILQACGLYDPDEKPRKTKGELQEVFNARVESRLIDFATGAYVAVTGEQLKNYDQKRAAKDSTLGVAIPPEKDPADVKRRAKQGLIYLVKDGDQVAQVVLPIRGYGLWSTLWGFLAIESDLNTVAGLGYYDHKETPGLGGEVDNKDWKALWPGKKVFDATGAVKLGLVKGKADKDNADFDHQVDGLAGATFTADGVSNMLRYWLGPDAYGPFLQKLKS